MINIFLWSGRYYPSDQDYIEIFLHCSSHCYTLEMDHVYSLSANDVIKAFNVTLRQALLQMFHI